MENSFQTHFNILDSLEKFHLTWKSFQQFWKTFPTIRFFFFPEKQLSNTFYYFRKSGKISSDLEKFPEILEKSPDPMNLFFNEKELSKIG